MPGSPTVAVLVLNYNGREHLKACLPGLEAQVYPNLDIVVIDNGSTDGSLEYVRTVHPRVRLLALGSNQGFCRAYNTGVATVATDYVAILNNDTRVEREWLSELVEAAVQHRASVVGSRILDWDGRRVDFVGGITTFNGHSWQRQQGQRATTEPQVRDLLFACGGSMLVERRAFLDAGGFDEDFFAYFEDVDLGWRLSVLGHRIVLAPRAVTYHRLHGTAGDWSIAPRLRLYERNALAMIFKNYEDRTIARVLPAAIALMLYRAMANLGLDPEAFRPDGSRPPAAVGLSATSLAYLIALEDFGRALPALARKRELVQSQRQRSDRELFVRFGEPLRLHEVDDNYNAAARALIADFGIADLIAGSSPMVPVAVQPNPVRVHVGAASPLISVVIPTILANVHLPACLESLAAQDYPVDRIEVLIVNNGGARDVAALAARFIPRARVIATGRNLGFAAANNLGTAEATGAFVAFLNDDTRAERGWIAAMVDVARRRSAAAVASYVADWDGRYVDFAGGLINFEGRGFQEHLGTRVEHVRAEERPVLFANGAAMMVDRRVLLDAGGWDEDTFAYYEDTELGWRLWLLGHEVWFAPRALVRHRHQGTSARWSEAPRTRLLERNALRTIYALLETDNLAPALAAALVLTADRALLQTPLHRGMPDSESPTVSRRLSLVARARHELRIRGARRELPVFLNLRRLGGRGVASAMLEALAPRLRRSAAPLSRDAYLLGRGQRSRQVDGRYQSVPADAAARLLGLQDFLRDLPTLSRRRHWLQSRRRRSDREILDQFGNQWLTPVPAARQDLHNELHATLVRILKLHDIARPQ